MTVGTIGTHISARWGAEDPKDVVVLVALMCADSLEVLPAQCVALIDGFRGRDATGAVLVLETHHAREVHADDARRRRAGPAAA
jgi:hypothetical protein